MTLRFKSWLLAFALSAACAGIVACLNLALDSPEYPQPPWLISLHVACAFVGSLAITRFIQGIPAALQGPSSRSTVAQGVVAHNRVAVVNIVVPGKSAFFSTVRCVMILCFVLCLMAQFVQVGKLADDTSGSAFSRGPQLRKLSI
ncbi:MULTISPECIES: hypothetical protein [Paraburkholderia]|jgi:hypothetical protein|uniref:Uncharacterized protein n=1 Tax=Paraburkholderia madseniana TaxID=2599607 RepID=A0A6N6W1C2_9BURK|nr:MULTISPECIES: hypothetical protein [Paraburkholderia]KAE8753919.1 hypothetical protein FSO04_42435 [Paraburkholderia madseniana]MCX4171635.1 hypothetical protein [Paraburkholderia madseniana]MDQ6459645.1 hypothetical protein [Paraburkholderia madseniana]NPT68401.1 hypothetical protein [Paraburkholderia madseniana]